MKVENSQYMPDETKSNLEPIEEGDLNLKEKFLGGNEKPLETSNESVESQKEIIPVPEQSVERKEGQMEKEAAYGKILSKVTAAAPIIHNDVEDDAKIASLEKDGEGKINNLVNLAQMKGIPHAVKVAMHLEDNYVLDEFHDRLLSQELHDALVQKGMIKEI